MKNIFFNYFKRACEYKNSVANISNECHLFSYIFLKLHDKIEH